MAGEARSPITVIILSLVTCGIYYMIWMYSITNETSENLGDSDFSGGKVLLLNIVTCGVYGMYWWYLMGQNMQKLYEKKGQTIEDKSTLYLILGFAFFPAAIYIMQEDLNKIYE